MRPPPDDYAWTVERLRVLTHWLQFISTEMRSPVKLPWRHTWRGWRKGFGRLAFVAYGLEEKDPSLYVSSYVQWIASLHVNGYFDHLLNNKLLFPHLMNSLGLPCAAVLAYRRQGKWRTWNGVPIVHPCAWLTDILSRKKRIVVKPVKGYKGRGVAFLEKRRTSMVINGAPAELDGMLSNFAPLGDLVITDFVDQAGYARRLYAPTPNSIRLLTLWDPTSQRPFLAAAAQRIGTRKSFPVDNWKEGLGGLSSEVNLKTGVLGPGATVVGRKKVTWFDRHPETGSLIRGTVVPNWRSIGRQICRGAQGLPFAPLLGWDVLVTDNGFSVLELNGPPGLHVHQVHRPLLADPRVNRFYRAYGLVP